jgi:hypothetical protein
MKKRDTDISKAELQDAIVRQKRRKAEMKEGTDKAMNAFVNYLTDSDGEESEEFKKELERIVHSGRFSPQDIKRLSELANNRPISQAQIEQERSRLQLLNEQKRKILDRQKKIAKEMHMVEAAYNRGELTPEQLQKYADEFADELMKLEDETAGIDLSAFFGRKR